MSDDIRVVVDGDASGLAREGKRAKRAIDDVGDAVSRQKKTAADAGRVAKAQAEAVEDLAREYGQAERAVESYDRAAASHVMRLTGQGKKYREIAREMNMTEDELRELMAAQRAATRQNAQTEVSNEQVERSYREVGNSATRAGVLTRAAVDKQKQTLGEVGRVVRTGAVMAAGATALFAAHIYRVGSTYQAEMSRVEAVSGATEQGMTSLNQVALRLGAQTKFSASEAAQGMYELSTAGFEVGELAPALAGTLSLAAASGIELADASEIASDAVRGFGLDANQTIHVANVLAQAANSTALEMGDMQLALKYIAPVAVATGQSLEMMTAAMGVMGNAGIRGEQAGTTLRAGLLRLVNPTKMVKDGLSDLGLEAKDLYGPDGLLPLPQLVAKLEDGMGGLSQSQRTQALASIFGQEAVSGMLTVVDAGPAKLARLAKGFENSEGAASRAAKTMQDNVPGALEQVEGSFETFEIRIYQQFEEPLKNALLQVSDAIDREGPRIQAGFEQAMDLPEFRDGDLADKVTVLMRTAASEWNRLGFGDDIRDALVDGLNAAIPIAAEAAARGGGHLAIATVEGFIDSDVWGRLLIGGWLFTKLGGLAALRAAGTAAGATTATGMADGMAAGEGKVGQAAQGWSNRIKGVLSQAGWAAAVMLAIQAGTDAITLFQPAADDLSGRLDQIEKQGGTIQASLGSMFDKIPDQLNLGQFEVARGISDALGLGDLDDAGDDASRLKEVLEEVNSVGLAKNAILRREGQELLNNLDLTEAQREEVQKVLNLRPAAQSDVQGGIDRLAGGLITRMSDIRKLMRENSVAAAQAFGEGSPQWRSAAARNINAAVVAIRQGMRQGVIETSKGKREIRQLLARRDLLTGADPVGLAQGFRKSWARAGSINQSSIKHVLGQLDQMPKGARSRAAQMLIQMARQMEKDRKLPEGSMSKLRSALLTNLDVAVKGSSDRIKKLQDAAGQGGRAWSKSLDGYGKGAEDGMGRANKALKNGVKDASDTMDKLEKRAGKLTAGVGGPFKRLPTPVRSGMDEVAVQVNAGLKAVGSDKTIEAFAGGGMMRLAGQGLQDSIPLTGNDIRAMAAPGEDLVVFNRHQRPMMDAAVSEKYGVSGLGGFFNKYDKPHYMAKGGIAPGSSKIDRPKLAGTPSTARDFGQGGINMFLDAAKELLKKERKAQATSSSGSVPGYTGPPADMKKLGDAAWVDSHTLAVGAYLANRFNTSITDGWRPADAGYGAPNSSHKRGTPDNPGALDFAIASAEFQSWVGSHVAGLTENLLNDAYSTGPHNHVAFFGKGGVLDSIKLLAQGGEVVRVAAPILTRKGFDHKSTAGIMGNAWQESTWNPAAMEPGTDNGGLFGFTAGEKSLASMRAYAENHGKPWTDVAAQINFMLQSGGSSLRGAMNAKNTIADTTKLFMDEYERPNPDYANLGRRIDGGHMASKIMRGMDLGPLGSGEGGSGRAERAARLQQREARVRHLREKAGSADTPKDRKAAYWQLINSYAKWGNFESKSGKDERGEATEFLSRASAIASLANPNAGASQLSSLAKWLDKNVDLTGAENENESLVRKLEKTRDKGGDRAVKKRKRKFARMARFGGNNPWGGKLNANERLLAQTRETIDLAERTHSSEWSDGGSDYTDAEVAKEIRLNQKLLGGLGKKHTWLVDAIPWVQASIEQFKAKIEEAKKDPNEKWKLPGYRMGLNAAREAMQGGVKGEGLRQAHESVIGTTGLGGEWADTVMRLRDLGVTGTVEKARTSEIDSLLKEQLAESQKGLALSQAQYGVFGQFLGGMDLPYLGAFAMGTAGRRVGRTGLAVLHEDEKVTPAPKGPYGPYLSEQGTTGGAGQPVVTLVLADKSAELVQLVSATVDGKKAEIKTEINQQLGRERRQLATAPGR